ncbi:CDP-diacylglycerol--serine O-phosphatidyltransferase 1 [Zea mays]|uniref:CDP-diacylglycerol--serine O-phosphatidyltransferase n=1 Tax=Zea mays TaxID=4577 RepID=A0A1D6HK49_MAIZE|nr:CDP-diacylglycerol--serine O-phosphatidyltransferase 1 [Zea mays]AQK74817.1 CDP-diacylglycerol--serine O-phosphatidyltransferase 1 [Zea mays]AQK74818.1 CDP-diacylglycerol--serine O-phosphatidyltransferase 1 [Zea mays]AQK74820.1 CDP-diacylglycerol--serine O-phosphatidyltransferase 1 [Zea mays]AQK74822.1 CDP-diacylglycerol--serine O-phosphatidyltransferase 1 [Zea mays]
MVADPYAPRFFPYAPSAPFHPWPRIPDVEIWELKLEISRMRVRLTADDGRRKNCGGRSSQCSDGKARRRSTKFLSQFTPTQWDKDQWHPFMGPLRSIQVLFICVVFMIVEINTFFLKLVSCCRVPQKDKVVTVVQSLLE